MNQISDIRRFNKSYIKDVQALSKIIFGKRIPKNYYLTLFGPGDDYLGYMIYEDGKVVAFFAAFQVEMNDGKTFFKAAQPVNVMIHPLYRNNNYFLVLYYKLQDLARSEGIVLFFGWPNSDKLFGKLLSWKKICTMYKVTIPVKTIPIGSLIFNIKLFGFFYKKFLDYLFKYFSIGNLNFANARLNLPFFPHILRSQTYLDQKIKLGARVIKVLNKVMLINFDYRLKIGEIENCTLEEFSRIIRQLKPICVIAGLTEIVLYLNPTIPMHQLLIKEYGGKEDLTLMYKIIDSKSSFHEPILTFADFDTF